MASKEVPCGRPDGHKGQHRSPEVAERKRVREREWSRTKYATDPEWAERKRVWSRTKYATDPEWAERRRERKRIENMTPKQIERKRERDRIYDATTIRGAMRHDLAGKTPEEKAALIAEVEKELEQMQCAS